MTKPLRATEQGLEPHWKIRVYLPGGIIHLASHTEPVPDYSDPHYPPGTLKGLHADWITDHDYADTLGHLDWSKVHAATWRYSP